MAAFEAKPSAHTIVSVWNLIGLLDLVLAVGLGVSSSPGPLHMIDETPDSAVTTTLFWLYIPGVLVMLLISSHLAIPGGSSRQKNVHSGPETQS